MQQLRAYPRVIWLLSLASVIFSTGMAFIWPLVMIYIHQELGETRTVAGLLLALNQGAFIVGSIVGGQLFDRWGKRQTVLFAIGSAIPVSIAMAIFQDIYVYGFLLLLNGFFSGCMFPLIHALAATYWPEGGRRGINLMYVAINVGVAAGSMLGGLSASISFAWSFLGNATVNLIVLFLYMFILTKYRVPEGEKKKVTTDSTEEKKANFPVYIHSWIPLALLCFGLIACWIGYVQWQTVISTYMQELGISLTSYSYLWTLNGLVILFGQPLIAWIIHHVVRSLKSQIVTGGIIFVISFLILTQTTSYYGFLLAMLIMTFGEMLVWPGIPTIAAEMAPDGKEGRYQGIVSGAASAGRMIGPLFGAIIFEAYSPQAMLMMMALLSVAATTSFFYYNLFMRTKRSARLVKEVFQDN